MTAVRQSPVVLNEGVDRPGEGVTARRRRRSLVVFAGDLRVGRSQATSLIESLARLGIETAYLGHEHDPGRIAAAALEMQVDAIELCLVGSGRGVPLLRQLLRELIDIGRRDVSIVVHKAE